MISTRGILPVVFFSSLASLSFEVLLARIFSISLSYHFAFMIISIAMLGLAAGGTMLSVYPRLEDPRRIVLYSFCLGVSLPVGYLLTNLIPFDPVRLSWQKTEVLLLGLYYLLLALPFFFTGLIIATALTARSDRAGLLYGTDLLGAGIGSLGILLLMGTVAPERGVFILSAIVFAASACVPGCGKTFKTAAAVFIAANLAVFFIQPGFTTIRISPYKELSGALRYPGATMLATFHTPFARIDTFISPAVRYAPGLSLAYTDILPDQIGFSVDAGNVSAVTKTTDRKSLRFLSYLPAALPYEIGKRNKVLVIDPGGGLQLLLARYYGTAKITGVETNPWLLDSFRREFNAISGDLYGEDIHQGLARSWLSGRKDGFDLIDISLQGAEPSGSFGIAEDYRYTVDALREYISHLEQNGILCINLFIVPPPRYELRVLATLATAMESMGIRDPARHIAAIRSWGSISILAKKSPLTGEETASLRRFARDRWFDTVYFPGIAAENSNIYVKMQSNGYFEAFSAILSPEKRGNFMDRYIFDIKPVHDDSPFFHYMLKTGKMREVYRVMGGKWQSFLEQGYIIPALLIQAAALSALLMVLPALAQGRKRDEGEAASGNSIAGKTVGVPTAMKSGKPGATVLLAYFAFLGAGFMFVEITWIQKLILPLANPSYAMASVLASLLFSSGIGSLSSSRYALLQKPACVAATAFTIALYGFLLPLAPSNITQYGIAASFLIVFVALFPAGFLMGIPFPAGLGELGRRNPQLIPWAWAINGCFSVLGPLIATLLAIEIGFRNVMLTGALFYFLAFLTITLGMKRKISERTHKEAGQD